MRRKILIIILKNITYLEKFLVVIISGQTYDAVQSGYKIYRTWH